MNVFVCSVLYKWQLALPEKAVWARRFGHFINGLFGALVNNYACIGFLVSILSLLFNICVHIHFLDHCMYLKASVGMFLRMLISSMFISTCDINKMEYLHVIYLLLNKNEDAVSKPFISGFNDIL